MNKKEPFKALFFYIIINNPSSDTAKVGIDIIAPYLMKSKKLNLISCFFKMDNHIIPARAPIGVKKAPIFEPIIEA